MADLAAPQATLHSKEQRHHFDDMEQQHDAGNFGMWVFLATEVLFFGGMFASYIYYRLQYFPAFEAGSHLLEVQFGATNTAVLIASSLTMALAIRSAQLGRRNAQIVYLILTMLLGTVFLVIKFTFEWAHDYRVHLMPGFGFHYPGVLGHGIEMFFCFYFFMTGLHALHMIIGIGIVAVLTIMSIRGRFNSEYYTPLEITGLYWHFVDIIWIFLFPLLYLIGGRY